MFSPGHPQFVLGRKHARGVVERADPDLDFVAIVAGREECGSAARAKCPMIGRTRPLPSLAFDLNRVPRPYSKGHERRPGLTPACLAMTDACPHRSARDAIAHSPAIAPPAQFVHGASLGFLTGRLGSMGLHEAEGLRSLASAGRDAHAGSSGFPCGVPEPGRGRLSVARLGWPAVSSSGFGMANLHLAIENTAPLLPVPRLEGRPPRDPVIGCLIRVRPSCDAAAPAQRRA